MRVLFLSRWYPYPPDNGSKIRVFNLLGGLCEQHEVTLISFFDPSESSLTVPKGHGVPVRIHLCPYREFNPQSARGMMGYLTRTPRYLVDTHSEEMSRLIGTAIRRLRYDLVIASQLSTAAYFREFRGIPAIFEEVELGIYQPADAPRETWSTVRRGLTWAKHRRFMSRLLDNFVLCTVASDVERGLLASAAPNVRTVHVVPNSVRMEPDPHKGAERVPGSLIFTGSPSYAPNHDAMTWFLDEIFPAIASRVPDVRLTITGDSGARTLPAAPNVKLTGRVADVRKLLAVSAVSIAPIRQGGGTRLKILEALAVGTPVVATAKAVEGLGVRDGEHVLIADTPRTFADAVEAVLRDPVSARAMADRAWHLCRERYDASVVVPQFLSLVAQAAAGAGHALEPTDNPSNQGGWAQVN